MKLEDILKQKGWTDADIAALAPMLADQRFRTSMEEAYGAVATERDQLKERDAKWEELREKQWQPKVNEYEQQLAQTRLELAQERERIKIAKDFGYLTPEAEAKAAEEIDKQKLAANGFDPKKYVSMEDAARMLDAEGQAIAMAADINNEYSKLTGQSLYDYETEIDGRRMRGLSALREEAKAKRVKLDQYVSQKFDFQAKRQAMADTQRKAQEDALRKDEREKVTREMAEKYGNPLMAPAMPSRSPFFAKKEGGKMPWDVPQAQLKQNRIERAIKTQMTGQPN